MENQTLDLIEQTNTEKCRYCAQAVPVDSMTCPHCSRYIGSDPMAPTAPTREELTRTIFELEKRLREGERTLQKHKEAETEAKQSARSNSNWRIVGIVIFLGALSFGSNLFFWVGLIIGLYGVVNAFQDGKNVTRAKEEQQKTIKRIDAIQDSLGRAKLELDLLGAR